MNFVISDVMTVSDEETLMTVRPPSPKKLKYTKNCFVPLCPNTTKSTPEKLFITVPTNPTRRQLWMDAAERTCSKNPKTPFFCCQDHFDLEKDMLNYQQYLKMGGSNGRMQMCLVKTAVPEIFVCRQFGHLSRKDRIATLRKLHEENRFTAVGDETKSTTPLIDNSRLQDTSKFTCNKKTKNNYQETAGNRHKRRRIDVVQPAQNSVFIEMPAFENEDAPDYFQFEDESKEEEEREDVIVIEDSDQE